MRTLNDFYRSKEWVMLRLALMQERLTEDGNLICAYCGKPIINKYDCIGHHKIPLTERNYKDAEISLNPNNIDLVHHVCHNKIHDKLGSSKQEVYLVYGPPLAGKNTWVSEVAEHGDLIVDMDNIWQMISGCNRYVKPQRLTDNVFGIRDALLEQVKTRRGSWKNAYVIGGYPLIGERERICRMLGAKEIFIECSIDECLDRLSKHSDGRNVAEWVKYILDWWEKYGKYTPQAPQKSI